MISMNSKIALLVVKKLFTIFEIVSIFLTNILFKEKIKITKIKHQI